MVGWTNGGFLWRRQCATCRRSSRSCASRSNRVRRVLRCWAWPWAPQKLAVALARLAALVGPDRVGTPVVPDAHRSAAPLPLRVLRPPLQAEVLPEGKKEPPMDTDEHRWGARAPSPSPICVHLCSSVVFFSRLRTADHRLSGDVRRASGPWKLRGGWWSDAPVERDYYDAELSSGALVRLYRDVLADAWFVDGVYD